MPQGISGASITGFENIIKNLNIEILAIEGGTRKGLIEVQKFIYRDMVQNTPLIPLLTGELRKSYSWEPITEDKIQGIRFGFHQNYALWVHEMYGAKHWTLPGSGAGFFMKSIVRNHDEILQIVHANAKIK